MTARPNCAAPQNEVEQFFLSSGALNVIYYGKYWLGLNTTKDFYPTVWFWTDRFNPAFVRGSSMSSYGHWGTWVSPFNNATTSAEPNNRESKSEYCASADYLQDKEGSTTVPGFTGNVRAWGWNDQDCNRNYAFICKTLPGGWRCRGRSRRAESR